ncbi:MAG: hypothetical protein ACXVEQ_12990 [Nocardioidaceae bacterium]
MRARRGESTRDLDLPATTLRSAPSGRHAEAASASTERAIVRRLAHRPGFVRQ